MVLDQTVQNGSSEFGIDSGGCKVLYIYMNICLRISYGYDQQTWGHALTNNLIMNIPGAVGRFTYLTGSCFGVNIGKWLVLWNNGNNVTVELLKLNRNDGFKKHLYAPEGVTWPMAKQFPKDQPIWFIWWSSKSPPNHWSLGNEVNKKTWHVLSLTAGVHVAL